jgi:hypothetical protein
VTTTSVAIATGTPYTLRIDCRDSANVKFYINGTLVATHTNNLPTATQAMGWGTLVTNLVGGVGSAKAFLFGRTYWCHK